MRLEDRGTKALTQIQARLPFYLFPGRPKALAEQKRQTDKRSNQPQAPTRENMVRAGADVVPGPMPVPRLAAILVA
jgi:hypothetical protein